jgi:hypothetical protein
VGHALAFTFTGTGMCLAAVPPLMATIGRKATYIVIGAFYLGSIMLGLLVNLILGII